MNPTNVHNYYAPMKIFQNFSQNNSLGSALVSLWALLAACTASFSAHLRRVHAQ